MSSLFQSIPDGWQRTTLRHLGQGPKNGAWGDAVEELDWAAGEIFKALKKHKIDEIFEKLRTGIKNYMKK